MTGSCEILSITHCCTENIVHTCIHTYVCVCVCYLFAYFVIREIDTS